MRDAYVAVCQLHVSLAGAVCMQSLALYKVVVCRHGWRALALHDTCMCAIHRGPTHTLAGNYQDCPKQTSARDALAVTSHQKHVSLELRSSIQDHHTWRLKPWPREPDLYVEPIYER